MIASTQNAVSADPASQVTARSTLDIPLRSVAVSGEQRPHWAARDQASALREEQTCEPFLESSGIELSKEAGRFMRRSQLGRDAAAERRPVSRRVAMPLG